MAPWSRRLRRRSAGGFTLLELMVVVILVGILAATAIPTMSQARVDRHAYEDAARIADLVRDARTHALGRGAAVMVTMTPAGVASYESVSANPGGAGNPRVPVGSCGAPSLWTNATRNLLRQVVLDGSYETDNGIAAGISAPTGQSQVNLCFTPMGRAFLDVGAQTTFTTAMTQAVVMELSRKIGSNTVGLRRQVVVPPSGNARIVSL